MTAEFVYESGIHLQDSVLWLDATEPRKFCFVSDGRPRRLPRHGRVLASPPTVRFCRVRLGSGDALIAPYNRPFSLGDLRLELLPGGSMLGSAQLSIQRQGDHIVYTGFLGPLNGLRTAIRPQIRRCDQLVMNSPSTLLDSSSVRNDARQRLLTTLEEIRKRRATPVVLCEPMGLAQEITAWCQARGMVVRSHRTIARFTADYQRFGAFLAHSPGYRGGEIDADVLIFPRLLWQSSTLAESGPREFVIPSASGVPRAEDPEDAVHIAGISPYGALDELVEYVRSVGLNRITVAGRSWQRVARAMRAANISVAELRPPAQGSLFG